MLSRFHRIPERNGQTDGRTDRIAMSISCKKICHYITSMAKWSNRRNQMIFAVLYDCVIEQWALTVVASTLDLCFARPEEILE